MLKSIRNSIAVTSILYIVLGVALVIFPSTALKLACSLIGVVTLVYGAVRILSYFKQSGGAYGDRFDLFSGVLLAAAGIFLLVCPQFIVSLIPIALGIYILVDSLTAIRKALDMKALGFGKWGISLAAAIILAVLGVLMIINPFGSMETLVVFIGWCFMFDGVYTLINTIVADRITRG